LFNVLSNRVEWEDTVVLDLFSGTGNMAFEFLSRGCPEVVCVEREAAHCAFIRKVREELGDKHLEIVKQDVFRYMERCGRTFDLVFADPPYELAELETIPGCVFGSNLLREGGLLVLEHPEGCDFSGVSGFREMRRYGGVGFSLMER
jgi:16S rRNA (guanine(966)-N(2))-methyltransferase RsmD